MSIRVTVKQVYGRDVIYPACGISAALALMAKQSTLTMREIRIIKSLGYSVDVYVNDVKVGSL